MPVVRLACVASGFGEITHVRDAVARAGPVIRGTWCAGDNGMKALVCVDNDLRYEDILSALDWCLDVGEGDEVLFTHVVTPLRWMPQRSDSDLGWVGTERGILEKVQSFLEQTAARLPQAATQAFVLEGDATGEILEASAERNVDVIVLGATGQARSQDFLVGSVAEKISSASSRNVLLVRGSRQGAFRVVISVDGSASALEAVRAFAQIPGAQQAEIQLLHVLELPPVTWDLDVSQSGQLSDSIPAVIRERGDTAIKHAREVLDERQLTAEIKVRRGYPAAEILEGAKAFHADLLVIGSRGLGGSGTLSGGVARRVARHATCSVYMVHPHVAEL